VPHWKLRNREVLVRPSASLDLEVPSSGTEIDPDGVHAPVGLAITAVMLAALCWSSIGIAYRLILDEFPVSPISIVAIRASTSAVVLLTIIMLRHELRAQTRLCTKPEVRWWLLAAGLLSGTGFYIALIYTFEVAGVAVGTVLLYFAPSIVAFGAWAMFKDRITRIQKLALCLSLVGVIGVSGVLTGGNAFQLAGVVLGITSAICYASYSLIGQQLLRRLNPLVVVAFTGLVGSIGMWTIKLAVEGTGLPSIEALLWIIGVTGVATTLVPLVLYTWGLSKLGAARASLLTTLEPVAAVFLAFIILDETLSSLQLAGGGLVLVSVVIAGLERARN
jgi:drug/metabolite transporter, DME family